MGRELRVVEIETGKVVSVIPIQDGASDRHVEKAEMGLLRRVDLDRFYVVDSKHDDVEKVAPTPRPEKPAPAKRGRK